MSEVRVDPMRIVHVNLKHWREGISNPTLMTLEQEGFYWRILRQIYEYGGNLRDDDLSVSRLLWCDIRVYRRLKCWLIGIGKIHVKDGMLRNARADEEMVKYREYVAKRQADGVSGAEVRWGKKDSNQSAAALQTDSNEEKSNKINGNDMPSFSSPDSGSERKKSHVGVSARKRATHTEPMGFSGQKIQLSLAAFNQLEVQCLASTLKNGNLREIEAAVLSTADPRASTEALERAFKGAVLQADSDARKASKAYVERGIAEAKVAVSGGELRAAWVDGRLCVANGFEAICKGKIQGIDVEMQDVLDKIAPYVDERATGQRLEKLILSGIVNELPHLKRRMSGSSGGRRRADVNAMLAALD